MPAYLAWLSISWTNTPWPNRRNSILSYKKTQMNDGVEVSYFPTPNSHRITRWATVSLKRICLGELDMPSFWEEGLALQPSWLFWVGCSPSSSRILLSKVCTFLCHSMRKFNERLLHLSAEEFSSASRSVKPGLVCSGIVRGWKLRTEYHLSYLTGIWVLCLIGELADTIQGGWLPLAGKST